MEKYTMVYVLAGMLAVSSVIIAVWALISLMSKHTSGMRSMLALGLACFVGVAAYFGAEEASKGKFSLGQEGFIYLGKIHINELVRQVRPSIDACPEDDSLDAEICQFVKLSYEHGPTENVIVVRSVESYRLRSGRWPNIAIIELPKDRVVL